MLNHSNSQKSIVEPKVSSHARFVML